MAGEEPRLGVSADRAPPAGLGDPPSTVADGGEPPVWPPAAQWLTAGLMALTVVLLTWRGWGMSRYGTRPLPIEPVPLAPIDVNEADEITLRDIPWVGPVLARRIVEHREAHGPFRSLEELRQVSGVGPATLERLREQIRIGESYTEVQRPPPRVVRARAADPPEVARPPGGKKIPPEVPLDVNQASPEQLMRLPGIGPTLAKRIVETRSERPFATVEELRRVKGIGVKTLERLRPHVVVGPKAR